MGLKKLGKLVCPGNKGKDKQLKMKGKPLLAYTEAFILSALEASLHMEAGAEAPTLPCLLAMWELDHCDPKCCHETKSGISVDSCPMGTKYVAAADRRIVANNRVAGIDCSWAELPPVISGYCRTSLLP